MHSYGLPEHRLLQSPIRFDTIAMEHQNRFDLSEHENERFSQRRVIYAAADITCENTDIQHDHIVRHDVAAHRTRV